MGRVYHHEIGKRHTSNMSNCQDFGRGVVNQQQAAMVASSTIQQEPVVHVAPGEPVPPGFEGEVEKVCEIQVRESEEESLFLILFCFEGTFG